MRDTHTHIHTWTHTHHAYTQCVYSVAIAIGLMIVIKSTFYIMNSMNSDVLTKSLKSVEGNGQPRLNLAKNGRWPAVIFIPAIVPVCFPGSPLIYSYSLVRLQQCEQNPWCISIEPWTSQSAHNYVATHTTYTYAHAHTRTHAHTYTHIATHIP